MKDARMLWVAYGLICDENTEKRDAMIDLLCDMCYNISNYTFIQEGHWVRTTKLKKLYVIILRLLLP